MLKKATQQLSDLGNSIRIQRKKLKVTAIAAAESAGLSRVTWHRIEKGEPSVSAGSYANAIAVLGLHLSVNEQKTTIPQSIEDFVPLKIPFKQYPQLKFLAWQIHGTEHLTPKEAWGIYQRNWRHVEEEKLTEPERLLIKQLQAVFEG